MNKLTLPLLFAVCVLLSACSSYSVYTGCKEGDTCVEYAAVSEGEAGGLYATVTGEATFCKVTTYGSVEAWFVSYKGKRCDAELNGSD